MLCKKCMGNQLSGHVSEHIVAAEVTTKLRCLYREQPAADIGVDGEIEMLDERERSTGDIIKVQVKSRKNDWKVKGIPQTKYEYWSRLPFPVIVCIVNRNKRRVKWFDTSMRKIGKQPNLQFLRRSSRDKLLKLAAPYAEVRPQSTPKEALFPADRGASKVAFVGQNLHTLLNLETFWRDLGKWLRGGKDHIHRQCVLVMQSPEGLYPIDQLAAEHMWLDTFEQLEKPRRVDWLDRVSLRLHSASTLSMTVVDWHKPSAHYAVIVPKLQVDRAPSERVHLLVRGETYRRLIGRRFPEMLSGRRPIPLRDAGQKIRERFERLKKTCPGLECEMRSWERKRRERLRRRAGKPPAR